MIDAVVKEAKEDKSKHSVLPSVLNTQLRKMMNHDCKRYVEEHVMEFGQNYTIPQPTHIMDLLPIPLLMQQEKLVYPTDWHPTIPLSSIALRDLGGAAAKVLEEREKHYVAQHPLVSAGPHSYKDVIEIASKEIGREVRIEQRPFPDAVNALLKILFGGTEGVHPVTGDAAERMLLYHNRHEPIGNSKVVERLLGRKPTTYQGWVRMQVEKVKNGGK